MISYDCKRFFLNLKSAGRWKREIILIYNFLNTINVNRFKDIEAVLYKLPSSIFQPLLKQEIHYKISKRGQNYKLILILQ